MSVKLAEAITSLDSGSLLTLAANKIDETESMGPALLAGNLESVLKSFAHVQRSALTRLPPAFSILVALLEAPNYRLPVSILSEIVTKDCMRIRVQLDSRDIMDTDNARLYRRVLVEAWRSGLELDTSETTLLGVLRHELGLSVTDHLILGYHGDCAFLWHNATEFERELRNLLYTGIVFVFDEDALLPDELVPLVRRAIGVLATRASCRRLYAWLSNPELAAALTLISCKASGSKSEKIARLIDNWAPVTTILDIVNITSLRDIARDAGCAMYGSKEEVVERLISHFAADFDLPAPTEPSVEPEREPRALPAASFEALFMSLTAVELGDILAAYPELRQTGSKQIRISILANSSPNETSLLLNLSNRRLGDVLERLGLRLSGSKMQRVDRIMNHFLAEDTSDPDAHRGTDPEHGLVV